MKIQDASTFVQIEVSNVSATQRHSNGLLGRVRHLAQNKDLLPHALAWAHNTVDVQIDGFQWLKTFLEPASTSSGSSRINTQLRAHMDALQTLKRFDFQTVKEGALSIPLSLNGSGGAGSRSLMEITIEALESELGKHNDALIEAKEEFREVRDAVTKLKSKVLDPKIWGDPSFSELRTKYEDALSQKTVLEQTIVTPQHLPNCW